MGDPDMMMRCTVCTCLATRVTSASGFLCCDGENSKLRSRQAGKRVCGAPHASANPHLYTHTPRLLHPPNTACANPPPSPRTNPPDLVAFVQHHIAPLDIQQLPPLQPHGFVGGEQDAGAALHTPAGPEGDRWCDGRHARMAALTLTGQRSFPLPLAKITAPPVPFQAVSRGEFPATPTCPISLMMRVREGRLAAPAPDRAESCSSATRKSGHQARSSRSHWRSTVAGQTMRVGRKRPLWCRPARKAMIWRGGRGTARVWKGSVGGWVGGWGACHQGGGDQACTEVCGHAGLALQPPRIAPHPPGSSSPAPSRHLHLAESSEHIRKARTSGRWAAAVRATRPAGTQQAPPAGAATSPPICHP